MVKYTDMVEVMVVVKIKEEEEVTSTDRSSVEETKLLQHTVEQDEEQPPMEEEAEKQLINFKLSAIPAICLVIILGSVKPRRKTKIEPRGAQ